MVGIEDSKILLGTDIDRMPDGELAKKVEEVNVFARMNPLQKERIIKALRKNGHVVGYMGDGVNDAPSLHNADVGICVNTATDIAKEASDIILLEKSLKVIFNGVIEGRKVYGNIIKYMKMALSSDFGDVFSIFIASIFLPFDKERSGFVMGEGAGVIVLEELEHAKKRGAKIYAEIIGYGATSDAYHITSPEPTGDGAARAIKRAIEDANIKPEDIDYINAHGTSTHLNDVCETMAIKKALGENVCKKVMVSSTKGNTGHLLGAAGAIEAIFSIKAIENKIVPPTINYKEKDEECDLDIVPNEIRKKDLKIVMSNSLGFGGHNGSVIFKEYEE